MELPEIVQVARDFAVMVRIQGPDPKGLKMRKHAFHHHESGKTTLSASGFLLPDSFNDYPLFKHIGIHRSTYSALVVTTASILEPFLPLHLRDNPVKDLPELIPGAHVDVLAEGEKKANIKTPCWIQAQLLALVDVPASSLALQLLIEAHGGSPDHGSWEVGWSLAPLNSSPQSSVNGLQTQDGNGIGASFAGQKHSALGESSSPHAVAVSTTRIAFLGVSMLNSKDLPHIGVSPPNKRGDLLLVMGSPFGILSPLHFLNSISVGAVANCCPADSRDSSLLMADVRCLPGMEGGLVFSEHACLIGLLSMPLRQQAGGAEIQLVVTWGAITTALSDRLQKEPQRAKGNLDLYSARNESIYNNDSQGLFPELCCPSTPSFEKALPSIVLVTIGDGAWASGIILNSHGLILTNAHLLEPWRFGKTSSGTDEITLPALSIFSERHSSLPSLVKTSDSCVGDKRMSSTLYSINGNYKRIRVRLDHVEPRIWCDAKAVYVSKGPLDIALLQLESVPKELCPIVPDFNYPSPGSKAHVIGHGLFGPRTDLLPSVCSGVVARVVETQRPPHLYGPGELETGERYLPAMLETTAAVHPGVSGGAVINADGHMIGLVTSNARHGGGTLIPHLNFSIPCAALKPIFKFSDGRDLSILHAMDEPNELLSSVWALMPPPSPRPPPPFSSLPQSLLDKNSNGKGSRFAKFLAERQAEISPQPIKEEKFSAEILPSKL
ncbi:protease-like protein [Tasmannia lanceolata]|uniref:protease-like protein n=1 Tax=Tasmannia lanceolata TaxID=3420 RepID=UPI004062B6AB